MNTIFECWLHMEKRFFFFDDVTVTYYAVRSLSHTHTYICVQAHNKENTVL